MKREELSVPFSHLVAENFLFIYLLLLSDSAKNGYSPYFDIILFIYFFHCDDEL